MVGGGLLVATFYWYLYLTGDDGVSMDFNLGFLDTAMEAGGPVQSGKRARNQRLNSDGTVSS